jgi:hypothetical protein
MCDPRWAAAKIGNFHLSVKIERDWDATLAARYETTEEDMLMQIFGDFEIHTEDTIIFGNSNFSWFHISIR